MVENKCSLMPRSSCLCKYQNNNRPEKAVERNTDKLCKDKVSGKYTIHHTSNLHIQDIRRVV